MIRWLFLLLLLSGCSKELQYQEQSYVFGTSVEITIYGEPEARARQVTVQVMQVLQRLHDRYHAWQASELSAVNTAFAQGESRQIDAEFIEIVQDASKLSEQSQGLFNPAIGGLVSLWGFHADEFKAIVPDPLSIKQQVSKQPKMSDILLENNIISSKNKAVQLDLGGYAKGYALDKAAQILRDQGVHNALLNFGGNILALGKHGERAWRVGIQHPRQPGPLATLELHDGEAIGTSGDYQRYFMLDGRRYCHLLNPNTGYPIQTVQAVTVLTQGPRAGVLSDVSSKPVFVSGLEYWQNAVKNMNLKNVLLVDGTGNIYVTASLQQRLTFADKKNNVQVVP